MKIRNVLNTKWRKQIKISINVATMYRLHIFLIFRLLYCHTDKLVRMNYSWPCPKNKSFLWWVTHHLLYMHVFFWVPRNRRHVVNTTRLFFIFYQIFASKSWKPVAIGYPICHYYLLFTNKYVIFDTCLAGAPRGPVASAK